MIVDFHAHVWHPEIVRLTGNRNVSFGWGAQPFVEPPSGSARALQLAPMSDPLLQIADMDRRGIDLFVLSSTTVSHSTSWAEPAEQARLEALSNDLIGEWVVSYP